MITLFSGTPGSGKSLMIAREILFEIRIKKRNVICCNMSVNEDYVRKSPDAAKIVFAPSYNYLQHPYPFYEYAKKYHTKGKEGQTLIIFDEVQELLSPKVCQMKMKTNKAYVPDWLTFFSQHRHLGFDVYFVTQYDRMLVHDIRYLVEYNNIHRKIRNNGDMGFLLSTFMRVFLGKELFVQINKWNGSNEKIGQRFYTYSKKFNKVYDSYKKFSDLRAADSVSVPAAARDTVNFISQMENINKIIVFDKNKLSS